jgi:hypothetical protein
MSAKTIVIEHEYTDSLFLQDYVHYYSTSFFANGRNCQRVHFFDDKSHKFYNAETKTDLNYYFTEKEFDSLISEGVSSSISDISLQKAYLGFITIKPLQETIIGKTCFKTFTAKTDSSREHFFNTTTAIDVNLFGIPLKIEFTLPFQEQDSVVSVCATSALWSFLSSMGSRSNLKVPSPAEITETAVKGSSLARTYHSATQGLDIPKIQHVLRKYRVEPVIYEISNLGFLLELISAYMENTNQPLLLGLDVYTRHASDVESEANDEAWTIELKSSGSHLVVLTGFSRDDSSAPIYQDDFISNEVPRIDKLYVHNDQVGPFAKFEIHALKRDEFTFVELSNIGGKKFNAELSDPTLINVTAESKEKIVFLKHHVTNDDKNILDKNYYVPTCVITGSPSKVRSSYSQVKSEIMYVDVMIEAIHPEIAKKIRWKISLIESNQYKVCVRQDLSRGVFEKTSFPPSLLVKNLPKFIWRCQCVNTEQGRVFDIVIDATDIHTLNSAYMGVVVYDENTLTEIISQWDAKGGSKNTKKESFLNTNTLPDPDEDRFSGIAEEFKKFLNNPDSTTAPGPVNEQNMDHLDEFFGKSLSPLYIKPEERYSDRKIIPTDDIKCVDRDILPTEKVTSLDKEATYLWLLDPRNTFFYAQEKTEANKVTEMSFKLGHPCINDGQKAKMAGELKWKPEESKWCFSNASGRYCATRREKGLEQLEAVVLLLKFRGFVEGSQVCVEQSDFHGDAKINSFNQLKPKLITMFRDFDGSDPEEIQYLVCEIISGLPMDSERYLTIVAETAEYLLENLEEYSHLHMLYLIIQLINDSGTGRFHKAFTEIEDMELINSTQNNLSEVGYQIAKLQESSINSDSIVIQLINMLGSNLRDLPNQMLGEIYRRQIDTLICFGH